MAVAEDTDLMAGLEALAVHKGPQKVTCLWWREQSPELLDLVRRKVETVGHTSVARYLRENGARVTPPDLKTHAEDKCDSCRTS
jgi:hypothetical protein